MDHVKSTLFGGRQIVISPDSSSYIPISMFPAQMNTRHRQKIGVYSSSDDESISSTKENQSLVNDVSVGVAIHLGEMLNSEPRNLGGLNVENKSNSTIVLKTNRGKYRSVLESSSIALNPYGLPHTLVFSDDGFVSDANSIVADYHHQVYSETMNQDEKDRISFEYDLYIDNPFQERMNLMQVYPSRPDLVDIIYEHPSGENQMNGKNSRFNNCGFSSEERAYCNLAQTSTVSGPLQVKSGSKKTYVATVRLNKNGIFVLEKENESFMGYLHLKFHNIFISIALEYDAFISSPRNTFPNLASAGSDTSSENESKGRNKSEESECKGRNENEESFSQVESSEIFNQELVYKRCEDSISDSDPVMDRLGPPYVHSLKPREILLLKNNTFTTFDSINFGRIAAAVGGERTIGISVTNRSDKRVVMKQSFVHSHRSSKNENIRMGEPSQTDHDTHQLLEGNDDNFFVEVNCVDSDAWIEPGETLKKACIVKMKLLPSDTKTGLTDIINGSVIFRYGDNINDDSQVVPTNENKLFNDYIVEIPWKVSVTEGYLEYNLRKSFFQMDHFQNSRNMNCDFFERQIALTNHFTQTLRITEVYLKQNNDIGSESRSDIFCRSRFSVTDFDAEAFVSPGDTWQAIKIRFALKPSPLEDSDHLVKMKKCHLIIETDVGGEFQMPLVVEDGKVLIVPSSSIVPKECDVYSLHSCYRNMASLSDVNSKDAFREFLKSVPRNLHERQSQHFDPILLDFGLASPKSVQTESLYLVNHNSIPLDITIENPSYEGTQVRLGRVPCSFDTFINNIMIEGKKLLFGETSGKKAEPLLDYFRNFTFRDDIDVAPTSSESLKKIFHSSTKINVYKTKFDMNYSSDSPMAFNLDNTPFGNISSRSKLFLATSRNKEMYDLVSDSRGSSRYTFTIPPSARVRLEVSIISPPNDFVDHDQIVTDFATSGTIIKTDHGQNIPIVVRYSMFAGHISVTSAAMHSVNDTSKAQEEVVVHPLFRKQVHIDTITHNDTEFSLHIDLNSTMEVVKVESCNEWFEIIPSGKSDLQYGDSLKFLVRSVIHCGDQQSFYNCALLWLNDHNMIRERHCAFRYEQFEPTISGGDARTLTETKNTALEIIENAKFITDRLSKSKDLNVLREDYIAIQNAFSVWDRIKRFKMHLIQGGLRVYLLTQHGTKVSNESPIAATLKDVILRTELEMPTLLPSLQKRGHEKVLEFPVTDVSQINEVWLPIQNPTGNYLKVRLMLHDPTQFYIPSASASDGQSNWWFGRGGYLLPDERGCLCVSDHNVTERSGSGSSMSLFSPSLHATNAFSLGCTDRRCGCNFPITHDNLSKQRRSTVGASATQNAILRGRIYSAHGILDSSHDDADFKIQTQPFFMELKTMDEVTIPPFGNITVGPFFFRPPSNHYFSTLLSIQNNFTGLETFSIYGEGASVKLAFFDSVKDAGDLDMRFGKSALEFYGDKIPGYPLETKSVYLANLGEIQVNILDMWLSPAGASKFLDASSSPMALESKCRRHGFHLIGCDSAAETILLSPNQQKLIHISLAQECSFDSTYVSLNVKYESLGTTPKIDTETLLLVYELSSDGIHECRRNPIPASLVAVQEKIKKSKWRWLFTFSTFFIPFGTSMLITIDMVVFSRRNLDASKKFRMLIDLKNKKKGTSKKTGFKNWSSAYRCLSRADPNSQELVQLSKEQTRQMLLNTFKREDMISPNCILANGTFCREKQGLGLVSPSAAAVRATNNQVIHPKNHISLSLCDAVFPRRRLITNCEDGLPLVPCGLGWRVYSNVTIAMADTKSKSRHLPRKSEKQMELTKAPIPISDQVRHTVPQDRSMEISINHNALDKDDIKMKPVPSLVADRPEKNKSRASDKKAMTNPPISVESKSKCFNDCTKYEPDHKCASLEGFVELQGRKNNKTEILSAPPDNTEIDGIIEKNSLNLENDLARQSKKAQNTFIHGKNNNENPKISSAMKTESELVVKSNVSNSLQKEKESKSSKEQEIKIRTQVNLVNGKTPDMLENIQANKNHRINVNDFNGKDEEIAYSSQESAITITPKPEKQILSFTSQSLTQNSEDWSPMLSSNMSTSASPKATFHLPPPGLAPPPGFGGVSSELLPPSSPMKIQSLATDTLGLIGTPTQDEKSRPQAFGAPSIHSLENLSMPHGHEEETALNNFNESMDVMNFFNFLDESIDVHSEENPNVNNHDHASEDANFAPLLLNSNQNPWGDSVSTTRAGTYGFTVDEDNITGDDDSAMQILAPALFLNSTSEEVERTSSKAFDADAFFSDLFDNE